MLRVGDRVVTKGNKWGAFRCGKRGSLCFRGGLYGVFFDNTRLNPGNDRASGGWVIQVQDLNEMWAHVDLIEPKIVLERWIAQYEEKP